MRRTRHEKVERSVIAGTLKRVIAENGRDHIWGYAFAVACMIVTAGSTAFTALIMESVVNETFANKRADLVIQICGAIFAVFVIRGFAGYFEAVTLAKIGNNIVAQYQRRLFKHLMGLSVSWFSNTRSAHLAAQISQNVNGIRNVMNLTVTSAARDSLTLIALVGVMISKDWLLSLIMFTVAPPLFFALRYVSRRLRIAVKDAIEVNSRVLGTMQETIQGIAVVKAFTMEQQLNDKVQSIIKTAEQRANRIAGLSEGTSPLTESFAGIAIASVLGYAAFRSIYDNAPPGAFISFVTALLMAYDPARRLAKVQVQIERAVVNARMIYSLLDLEPQQSDVLEAPDLKVTEGKIELNGVSFAYGSDNTILKDVYIVAEGGKTTALVGPSGAGKSTIIALVPRFYDPTEGTIMIDGQDISKVTKTSLRRQLAYVSQQPYLFEGSIRDNIRYGCPEATNDQIEEAARLGNAHDFIMTQPEGYDTPVGENGITLSGGQRQRLSIARALVRDAPILLLDEATSALDSESEASVQKALDVAMKGRTVVVVAHRLSTVVNADKIVVMSDGNVIEQGTHDELAQRPNGLYQRLNHLSKGPGLSDTYSS